MYSKAGNGFHFHLNTSDSETAKEVPCSFLCECMRKNVMLRNCSLSYISPRSGRFSVFSLILSSDVLFICSN